MTKRCTQSPTHHTTTFPIAPCLSGAFTGGAEVRDFPAKPVKLKGKKRSAVEDSSSDGEAAASPSGSGSGMGFGEDSDDMGGQGAPSGPQKLVGVVAIEDSEDEEEFIAETEDQTTKGDVIDLGHGSDDDLTDPLTPSLGLGLSAPIGSAGE